MVVSLKVKTRGSLSSLFDHLLVYIFFALTLYIFLIDYDNEYIFNARYIFLVIAAIRGYYICIKRKFWLPILLAIFFSINYFICIFYQPSVNLGFNSFTYTILYIGFAILLLEESYGLIGSGILLTFCVGTVLFRYLRGVNPNNILTYTSRNYISILILLVLILFYLALYKQGVEGYFTVLIPAFMYLVICAVGYGRGGIITAAFLVGAFSIYISFMTQDTWGKRLTRIIAFVMIVIIVIYVIYNYQSFFLGKFMVNTTDDARLSYWTTFFSNNTKSTRSFLFGSNAALIRTDRNLHNSFLQCYASFGLIPFIVLIIMCIRAYIKGFKNKDYYLLILMTTLFLRAMTDKLFFQGYCEVFLYYFLFYWEYKEDQKGS